MIEYYIDHYDVTGKIGTLCKWILISLIVACALFVIVIALHANFWTALFVIILIAVFIGWMVWGLDD